MNRIIGSLGVAAAFYGLYALSKYVLVPVMFFIIN